MNKVFGTGFDDKKIVEIFSQICEAVNFIHSCGIIHRDLKPENVLWNEGKWKLCDFGSATNKVYDLANTDEFNEASLDIEKNTTPIYRSPEMCDLYRGQKIDSKSDIWALGCILYKLCTFQDPFPESNLQILNINYKWPESKKINPSFKEIVRCIFKSNPNERPTARELLGKLYSYFPDLIEKKWEIKTQTNTVNFDNPFGLFENVKQTKVIQDKVSSSRSSDFKNPNIGFQFDGEEEKSPEKVDPVDKDMSNRWNFSSFNQDPFANASQNNMKVDPFATASQSNTQIDPFAAASNVDPFANPFGNTSVDPFAATPNVDPFAAAANVKGTPPVDPFANDPFAQK
ncbi:CAMK family protein kinase [Histomonas meleagridis]|uniref:CAMK family protein kinase n=1 Tax=Histomonas meleagridis TaxID=135588 RepID=UPI0035594CF9|nr:CAMK family protein kinase [Histomonas meleagridis]